MKNVTCVLHHHIGPETPFEAGLNITSASDKYLEQVEWLTRHYTVISLDQMLSGDIPRKALLLTFDDAFHSVLDVVRSVLAPRNLPSVFFVNPGLLEPGAISLDSTLTWAAGTAGVGAVCDLLDLPARDSIGTVVVRDMASRTAAERLVIRDRVLDHFGPPDLAARAPLIDAQDLKELVSLNVDIGNHTMNHVHCRSLTKAELQTEIIDSKAKLEALSGSKVRAFSVPYGHEDDLTPEILDCVRNSGHEATFLVHSRSNLRKPAADVWYRTSLHHEPASAMFAELKVKPVIRSLRQMVTG